MISKTRTLIFFLCCIVLAGPAFAQEEPSISGTKKAEAIFQKDGLAIGGYDAVAYFTEEKARKGKKEFEYKFMGAAWRFLSSENRSAFEKNPDQYVPQYGGYCAFGMSHGYAAPINPIAWTVIGGKLYLNYDIQVLREWKKDIPGHVAKADINWPKIPKKAIEP